MVIFSRHLSLKTLNLDNFTYFLKSSRKEFPGDQVAIGHVTERISQFLDFHLRPHVVALASYLKDTSDYLNKTTQSNLPPGTLLVTMDVTSLYKSFPTTRELKLAESTPICTLIEVLSSLQSSIDKQQCVKFNINRNDVLDGARRAINRKSYNPNFKMSVKFTDDFGSSEGEVDDGGPTRELLRLLMKKIQSLSVFEGPINSRVLAFSASALQERLYHDAGVIIAISIVHGGPAPKFFSKCLYNSLLGNSIAANINDVAYVDLREQIKNLNSATSIEEIHQKMDQLTNLLCVSGCLRPVFKQEDRDSIVNDLVKFLVIDRMHLLLEQFQSGLKTLNVLPSVVENPSLFEELFIFNENERLTADSFVAIFLDIKYSPVGSNKRMEEKIIGYWRDF